MRYRKLNAVLRERFGERVYRVGLRGGFTCPNRDGRKGVGGCLFCNPLSNEPLGHAPGMPVEVQLRRGIDYVRERHRAERFIAFFSDYTTTYDEPGRLEALYRTALADPRVVGLALGTRPDCLAPAVLDLLERLAAETMLWVEVGIQTAHPGSLERLHRRHTVTDSRLAITELGKRGAIVSAHVILGLPGESPDDMRATARFLAEAGAHAVKIHNLHVLRGTRLEQLWRHGAYRPLGLDEYVDLAVGFLEHLPSTMIVQRLGGEAPRRLTAAPAWSVNKLAVMNAVVDALDRRDTWQGKAVGARLADLARPLDLPGPRPDPAPQA